MLVNIHKSLINDVIRYCQSLAPQEACGAFLGVCKRGAVIVDILEYAPITNVSRQPEHRFRLDKNEWISLNYETELQKKQIVGIYHSHLHTPAIPSQEDLQTLWYTLPSYWIVSLNCPRPDVKAYQLRQNGYTELPLHIL